MQKWLKAALILAAILFLNLVQAGVSFIATIPGVGTAFDALGQTTLILIEMGLTLLGFIIFSGADE